MATRTSTVEITMPQMGESVTEGTVLEWHKRVGDRVEADEPLLEVSTDKVDTEIPSPASGTLTSIAVESDQTVAVGAVLGEIETGAAPSAPPAGDDGGGADEAEGAGEVVDVAFPEMGDSVAEGTVLEWRVSVGDTVAVDDPLVEVSTDKVDAEVPAPLAGTVVELLVEADSTVSVGTVLCRIAAGDKTAGGLVQPAGTVTQAKKEVEAPTIRGNGDVNATPVAARMAGELGVDLSALRGTGPRGKVTKDDVRDAIERKGPAAAVPGAPADAETQVIRGPAATLVRFMNESRSIPTATSFRTVPVTTLDARRRALKNAGRKLSFTHLIAWAIVKAAEEWPVMGHSYAEADGKPTRVTPGSVSLGLAVDVERKDGARSLVVPVLGDAGSLAFADFVARYDELVAGARDNTLDPSAYQGANITLTNPGGLGTVASVPRLMPGQGAIVATGSIGYPPGLANVDPARLNELGVDKVMTMTSTYDHRVIGGAESGSFLRRLDELLQGEHGFYDGVVESLGVSLETPKDTAAPATAAEPVPAPAASPVPSEALLQSVQAATSVVKAHRTHGHLAATLDPLGSTPRGDPALDPASVNLTADQMQAIPAGVLRVAVPGETFAEALPHLRETYCGTIAYEVEHIAGHRRRVWLRQQIESGEHRTPLSAEHKRRLLKRLSEVEALETYLHKAFLGKKQFSIEGLDTLLPMLDEAIELGTEAGARDVVLGMAHRGRLNVQAHTVGLPYARILAEFEGEQRLEADTQQPEGGTGDVKYHYGASGTFRTQGGRGVTVTLSHNPSHLEFIDPVIEGRTRADQTSRKGREPHHDPSVVVPVLMHGDAAFPGQGVVAETLNLQALEGYSAGGTVHIITNNQLGFTTDPSESRSTRYASDLAKGFDIPIIHVNADDVEACIAAMRLAMAFRKEFGRDALIDLIGYRRYGHNETDEPAYTQPAMYEAIKAHPPVRKVYAERLVAEGVVTQDEARAMLDDATAKLSEAHEELRESMGGDAGHQTGEHEIDRTMSREPRTTVPVDTLRSLNQQLLRVPNDFTVHRKLGPQLEKRRKTLGEEGGIDWAQAEALSFASLLALGVPVRLTGQDTERGTFSQRHLTLHDAKTGERHVPIQHLRDAHAPFELHNSPLSEQACLGFEYGYSIQATDALVLWEAQFGDFVNGAQVIIDQFLVSGLAKWGQSSRLTLLLPHGYEGSGPEHSSARLERFLQLAAEGNIRVANPTTPAQYFHLLRRQALVGKPRPLVVMTPKSLLRLPAATSTIAELSDGAFHRVIGDPKTHPEKVKKLVLCSGKVFYDIDGHEEREAAEHIAVARVEQLYPFPESDVGELMQSFPSLERVVWVQEEPRNMGARAFMRRKMAEILPANLSYNYVGRQLRASPGEGYAAAHKREQARIVRVALDLEEDRLDPDVSAQRQWLSP
ncbi:MAG: multifunctional oxoglutarate decarboxylase/oxoglutarate dehydrogenase thiamine pyrophosphate-binding subunit/dihydrolipoyllysine-residue succinyltransferase subunit [Actinomycetota bacterium]|nr:multifunctional oxoglutarate decarboxylase/oxoglutarate dehydrogenase thiamine pyrophosphate-binding subunit/dihydrolipoyllysine-residue succinyltransferase subunit [Actinomycetota bacterium]MDQ3648534.1 multifunctional oxoglutarate decarboxylase/oxoglutarate dehydrogenase thiamine pyrophosphate-binding subunit/dihydrolipoyllysine-residue succinyltransferase subunit [Actinomycetota bacterium]